MSGADLVALYRQYLLPIIIPSLKSFSGSQRSIVEDASAFRGSVADPIWERMPLPVKMLNRNEIRYDEFLVAARSHAFQATPEGQLAARPDLGQRLEALAAVLFATPSVPQPVAAAAPVQPAEANPVSTQQPEPRRPAAAPVVAKPVVAAPVVAKPIVAKPVASPTPRSEARKSPQASDPAVASIPVGIDLGTTYSVIAYLDGYGRPTTIPNSSGDLITPSVILMEDDAPVIGKEAVLGGAMEPEKIAECVKRDMGSNVYSKKVGNKHYPPEVLSSLILRALKSDAERKLGTVRHAVITVPAYFDEARRQCTIDAGRLAGLEVLDIINEPTAAAIAYGHQIGFLDPKSLSSEGKPLRVLVYDLGGGTFDVTIVEIQGKSFRAIATDGDVALGGKDWDEVLVDIAAQRFIDAHREDPRQNPVSRQDLWLSAELAKKTLSERPKASIFVNHLGARLKVEISRAEFEEATAPLLGRSRTTTEIVVRQSGLSWNEIDKVLLVGGSTRMPQVSRMLAELSGKPPEQSVSVDEAVAHGAALYANLLMQSCSPSSANAGPNFSVTNINSHSLGIVGIDPATGRKKNQILIPKNTPLPHTVTRAFKLSKQGQSSVVIRVVEGESERPEACSQVAVCTISGLAPDLPAGTPVYVSYSYLSNGQLQITGQIGDQKKSASATLHRERSLDADKMQEWNRFVEGYGGSA